MLNADLRTLEFEGFNELNLVIKLCIWPWGSKSQSQSHLHIVEEARTDRTKLKILQTGPRNLLYNSFRFKLKQSVFT